MKGKNLFSLCIVLVVVVMMAASPVMAEKTIKWKLQTLWSSGVTPYTQLEDFCKKVKVMTNGRLEITVFPAGAIVPTFETLDAVKNNIIQVMNVWPGYFTGKEPAFAPLTDFLCAYEQPWEYDAFFHNRGGLELINELYEPYNAVTIGVVLWGAESMSIKYPVLKAEDFKGHKFRSPQGMTADLLTMLGAGVVVLPGEETYSALEKGVVDGADWSTPAVNHRVGFSTVADYFIYPGFRSMPISDFTVNKKEWNQLPEDIKQILKTAVRELNYSQLAQCAIDDQQAIKEMTANGAKALKWEKKDIDELRSIVREKIWPKWAAKSPMAKKVIDAQIEWLKEIGRIK